MKIPFVKMHGTGNVILIVDQRTASASPPSPEKLRRLGDSSTGPGFDQLLWISAAESHKQAASYRVFNADGSEVEQCGNGVRCVARYLVDTGMDEQAFDLMSPAGPVSTVVRSAGTVAVSMGRPIWEPDDIPFAAPARAASYTLQAADKSIEIAAVSMGNPHIVLRVPDVAKADVERLGPLLETHERFPQRTNVGFMQILDRTHIRLRVYERGVGETAACGTGACAAVVSARQMDELDDDVMVALPGGEVMVSWPRGDSDVWLTGNAEYMADGTLEL